ncbi:MAG: type IV pilus biogenesis/stability protein PilW [Gammaproteobacteria bacterium]
MPLNDDQNYAPLAAAKTPAHKLPANKKNGRKGIAVFPCLLPCVILTASLSIQGCGSSTPVKDRKESADIHLQLGVRYLDLNKLNYAKENLELALELEPRNAEVRNALAVLYERLKQPKDSKALYLQALELAPDDFGIQNNYGRFLCEQGEYDEGMRYLESALASPLNDRQWIALTNTGLCYLTQNKIDDAEAYFRKALQLQAFYAPALLEMQKISYRKAQYWASKGFLDRYLSVGKHTSETLWYAYQTERALGNSSASENYRSMLLEKFPLSDEAKKIIAVQRKTKHDE